MIHQSTMPHQATFDEAIEAVNDAVDEHRLIDALNAVIIARTLTVTHFQEAVACQATGLWEMARGNYREARECFNDAVAIALRLDATELLVQLYRQRGAAHLEHILRGSRHDLFNSVNHFQTIMIDYERSRRLAQEFNLTEECGAMLTDLGYLRYIEGIATQLHSPIDRGRQAINQATKIAQKHGNIANQRHAMLLALRVTPMPFLLFGTILDLLKMAEHAEHRRQIRWALLGDRGYRFLRLRRQVTRGMQSM